MQQVFVFYFAVASVTQKIFYSLFPVVNDRKHIQLLLKPNKFEYLPVTSFSNLKFGTNAEAYPSGAPFISKAYLQILDQARKAWQGQHSSLFSRRVRDEEKSFMTLSPGVQLGAVQIRERTLPLIRCAELPSGLSA